MLNPIWPGRRIYVNFRGSTLDSLLHPNLCMRTKLTCRYSDIAYFFLTALLFYIAWTIRKALLLIYVAGLFAVILEPLLEIIQKVRIRRWRVSRNGSIIILAILFVTLIAVTFSFVLPLFLNDLEQFTNELPARLQSLSSSLYRLPFGIRAVHYVNSSNWQDQIGSVSQRIFTAIKGIANITVNIVLIIILTVYFMFDAERTFTWSMNFVPQAQRDKLQSTLFRAKNRAQKWLIGQAALMFILGCASILVLGILHVRFFVAISIFASLANFIPVLGATLTVAVASLAAVMDSWSKLIAVLIFYLIYLQVENAYLTPRIMKFAIDLPAIAVIISLIIGGELAGILGALVAVPTGAIISTIIHEYLVQKSELPY